MQDICIPARKIGHGQRGDQLRIRQSVLDGLGEKVRFGLFEHAAEMFLLKIGGVLRLVAPRLALQRNENRGLFQGEDFKNRIAARARNDEIRRGIGACHIRFKFFLHIVGDIAFHGVALAAEVQDVVFFAKPGDVFTQRVVDGAAAAAAAEHEQRLAARGQAVLFQCFRAAALEQLFSQRRAAVFAVFELIRRLGEGGEQVAAFFRHQTIGQPRGKIALVGETGDFQFFGRKYDGQGNVAALGKYDVGTEGPSVPPSPFFPRAKIRRGFSDCGRKRNG